MNLRRQRARSSNIVCLCATLFGAIFVQFQFSRISTNRFFSESPSGDESDDLWFVSPEQSSASVATKEESSLTKKHAPDSPRTPTAPKINAKNIDNGKRNDDDDDDWFSPDRWWNQMRLYNKYYSDDTGHDGLFPFELCQYVEDVCRVQGHAGWVHNPYKVATDNIDSKYRRPVVEFYGHDEDDDFEDYGGDISFYEQYGAWNIGYFGESKLNQTVSSTTPLPTCSYAPVTNHFVLVGAYTSMLGEFYDRTYAHMVELIHFLTTASNRSWPAGPLPKDWHKKHARLTKAQEKGSKERSRNYYYQQSKNRTSLAVDALTLMQRFQKQSRFYLAGIGYKKKRILESHRAFLSLISDHPSFSSIRLSTFESMIETLMRSTNEGITATAPEPKENHECACVKRLFFCGYVKEDENRTTASNPPIWRLKNSGAIYGEYRASFVQHLIRKQVQQNSDIRDATRDYLLKKKVELIYNNSTSNAFKDSGDVEEKSNEEEQSEENSEDERGKETNHSNDDKAVQKREEAITVLLNLRAQSIQRHAQKLRANETKPRVAAKPVPAFDWNKNNSTRRRLKEVNESTADSSKANSTIQNLNVSALIESVSDDDFVNEWKFVGLAQRSDRRKWWNFKEVMDACRERFTNLEYKIVCLEIDVGSPEFRNQPTLHIAAHSQLSALIGVHGAQLAEAVFLPANALVTELLPFVIQSEIWGQWTRVVYSTTAIGKMFVDTPLNHIGFPLTLASAMHIECVSELKDNFNKTKLIECLKYDNDYSWDERDFTAPVHAVMTMIERFVVPGVSRKKDTSATASLWKDCEEIKQIAGDDYVLYNINCAANASSPVLPHHYYRTKEWLESKTHTSLESPSILYSL